MWDKGGRRGEEREQFSVHDPSLKPGFYGTHSLRGIWLLMIPTRKRVLMAPSYCTVTMCLVRAGCVTPRRADIKLNNGLWGLHHGPVLTLLMEKRGQEVTHPRSKNLEVGLVLNPSLFTHHTANLPYAANANKCRR